MKYSKKCLEDYLPLEQLALIHRAQHLDPEATAVVLFSEVDCYTPAETFEEFLRINQLPVYEEVLRC